MKKIVGILILSALICRPQLVSAGSIDESTTGSTQAKEIRIWPSEAPTNTCYGGDSKPNPSTGLNSATWFNYGDCGDWKIFDVTPNKELRIRASGDSCPSCALGHLNFNIYEYNEILNNWEFVTRYDGPDWYGNRPANIKDNSDFYYTPKYNRIKIEAYGGGFYIEVYGSVITESETFVKNFFPPVVITLLGILLLFLQIKYEIFWHRK